MNTAVRERPPVDARGRAPAVRPVDPAVPGWVLPLIVVLGVALRVWRILSNGLTFDESFTALAARLPVGDLLSYLRHNDSHPPLDYLIRAPFARAGASDFLLRSPSLLFSCAALALFAWWMRERGWLGVIATALMAASTFQVLYGGDARMYALLQLLGVAAAIITERWLRAPARWHAWAIGAVLLVALFDHVSGALLGAGLLAVAGVRRDRDAWRWRLVVTGAGLVWLAAWGPVMVDQLGGQWASWIPRTTPLGFAQTVSRQIALARGGRTVRARGGDRRGSAALPARPRARATLARARRAAVRAGGGRSACSRRSSSIARSRSRRGRRCSRSRSCSTPRAGAGAPRALRWR